MCSHKTFAGDNNFGTKQGYLFFSKGKFCKIYSLTFDTFGSKIRRNRTNSTVSEFAHTSANYTPFLLKLPLLFFCLCLPIIRLCSKSHDPILCAKTPSSVTRRSPFSCDRFVPEYKKKEASERNKLPFSIDWIPGREKVDAKTETGLNQTRVFRKRIVLCETVFFPCVRAEESRGLFRSNETISTFNCRDLVTYLCKKYYTKCRWYLKIVQSWFCNSSNLILYSRG